MSDEAPSITGLAAVSVDCAQPQVLVQFWAAVLGGVVELDPEGDATLRSTDAIPIDFIKVPDDKRVKNRLHFDLGSTNFAEAVEEVIALGATRADDVYNDGSWQVLRDPEGNEFCILRPRL